MTVEAPAEDSAMQIAGSVEAKFAQRLAANEKKRRDRAFKKLKQYLMARSARPDGGFVRDELIKIWKGLFYCMWMSDKPLIQEELAKGIAGILPQLRNMKTSMMYFDTFLETMHREWRGIDRLRMDKFYLLCRFLLQNMFQCLKDNQWEKGLIEWATGILKSVPLSALAPGPSKTTGPPLGLRYHIIDIYLEELSSTADDQLTSTKVNLLLTPIVQLVCSTPVQDLRDRALEKVFQEIIDQSEPAQKLVNELNEVDDDDIEEPILNFDYSSIADLLFETANHKTSLPRNRKKVYVIVKKLRGIAEGQMPLDDLPDILPDEDYNSKQLEENILKDLATQLEDEHSTGVMEKKQHRKTKKKAANVDDSICEADVNEVFDTIVTAEANAITNGVQPSIGESKKKKKQRKKSKSQIANMENNKKTDSDEDMKAVIAGSSPDLNDSVFDVPEVDSTMLELNAGQKSLERKRKTKSDKVKLLKRQKLLEKLSNDSCSNDENIDNALTTTSPPLNNSVKPKPALKSEEIPEVEKFADFMTSPAKPVTSSFLRVAASKIDKKQKEKSKGIKRKSLPATSQHSTKRVSFEMSKIQVQPFRKNDRSSAVSPSPSSKPFDPNKTPDFGLLKQRKKYSLGTPKVGNIRKKASDFF
uniref:Ribosomal RNA processing protein 1 homolog n=1 Tax=Phallusia mammillata TaxID=59560 RepID=A0A6F9DSC2_9ASCI|nr:ribosomal RNA processing protein 1 homolog [Phallusia mammillata]